MSHDDIDNQNLDKAAGEIALALSKTLSEIGPAIMKSYHLDEQLLNFAISKATSIVAAKTAEVAFLANQQMRKMLDETPMDDQGEE